MEIFPAHVLQQNELFSGVFLLGGELALPLSGGPRQPLDRQV
jgi:hypothetical protein